MFNCRLFRLPAADGMTDFLTTFDRCRAHPYLSRNTFGSYNLVIIARNSAFHAATLSRIFLHVFKREVRFEGSGAGLKPLMNPDEFSRAKFGSVFAHA